MKELSIEEKAKRYDDAIKIAKDSFNYPDYPGFIRADVVFPELKESEDEMIRKEIVRFIRMEVEDEIVGNKWIAWLEKHGEKKSSDKVEPKFKVGDTVKAIDDCLGSPRTICEVCDSWYVTNQGTLDFEFEDNWKLEKQGDKPQPKIALETVKVDNANKVEPKFKVGDWVVQGCNILKIRCVGNEYYCYETVGGYVDDMLVSEIDSSYHLWSIKDAKAGDVLSFNDGHGNDCIELIKSNTNKKIEFWFCLTNGNRYEVFDGHLPYTNHASREDAIPATKEQRDTLMEAMADAGYEWDAEKKEPKKIEQNHSWNEEDENNILFLTSIIEECFKDKEKITLCGDTVCAYFTKENVIERLKSLKPQYTWKPSDEQLEALDAVISSRDIRYDVLSELWKNLKKLKG